MFVVGCARGPKLERYRECLEPTLGALVAQDPSIRIVTRDDNSSLAAAYNYFLEVARSEPLCEGLLLVHDDVEILDRNLVARARRVLADPAVGVVGVVGAVGVWQMRWWRGRQRIGVQNDTGGYFWMPPLRCEVEAVDGHFLLLSRRAIETLSFDEVTFDGFHGYDVDVCMSARAAGLKVMVEPFRVFHHSQGSGGGEPAIELYARRFSIKWKGRLARKPLAKSFPRLMRGLSALLRVGRALQPARRELTSIAASVQRRLRPTPPTGSAPPRAPLAVSALHTCGLCGARASFDLVVDPMFSCPTCKNVITLPQPMPNIESQEFFDVHYRRGAADAAREREALVRLTWLESVISDGVVLEVGPGTGNFMMAAQSAGYEAIGIEPSAEAAEFLRSSGLLVQTGTISDWVRSNHGFECDAIVMFHVLEHLPEPLTDLRALLTALKVGGSIIVEVPNLDSVVCGDTDPLPDFHVTQFSEASLRQHLERAGFVDVSVTTVSTRPYVSANKWGDRVRRARLRGFDVHEYLRATARRPDGTHP